MSGAQRGARRWQLGPLIGAGLSIGAMLGGVSGLAFAIGVYLPLATMTPLVVGGCVRAGRARPRSRSLSASARSWCVPGATVGKFDTSRRVVPGSLRQVPVPPQVAVSGSILA
jgi:hypothetical protein